VERILGMTLLVVRRTQIFHIEGHVEHVEPCFVDVDDCWKCSCCASHNNWTSVHQLPLQSHCFIGSGGGSWCWSGCCGSSFCEKHNTRCHLVQEGGERTAWLGRTRPKHHFFRESRSWCFEGSWERKRRSLGVQTPPSYFSRPSKFTAARWAATSPRCPVCVLAKYLCALALLHLIHSIEPKFPHQDGRRIATAHCVLSANSATPKSCVWVACGGGILPLHSRPSLKDPWAPRAHVAVAHDNVWANV